MPAGLEIKKTTPYKLVSGKSDLDCGQACSFNLYVRAGSHSFVSEYSSEHVNQFSSSCATPATAALLPSVSVMVTPLAHNGVCS